MTLTELNQKRDEINDALKLLAERPAKAKARLLEIEAELPELVLLVARGQASGEMLDSLALERIRLNAILSEPIKKADTVLKDELFIIRQKTAVIIGADNAARNLADFKALFNKILAQQSCNDEEHTKLSMLANSVRDRVQEHAFQIMVTQLKTGLDKYVFAGSKKEHFAKYIRLEPLS